VFNFIKAHKTAVIILVQCGLYPPMSSSGLVTNALCLGSDAGLDGKVDETSFVFFMEPKLKGPGSVPMRNKPDMTKSQDFTSLQHPAEVRTRPRYFEAIPPPLAHRPSTRAAFFTKSQSLTGAVCNTCLRSHCSSEMSKEGRARGPNRQGTIEQVIPLSSLDPESVLIDSCPH